VRKLNFGLPLVARKTVWVYRVFWAKIETKPKKNTYKIKTKFFSFYLFIYYYYIIILLLLLFRQSKKPKRKLIYFLFFYTFFWKKKVIIIYSIIYL